MKARFLRAVYAQNLRAVIELMGLPKGVFRTHTVLPVLCLCICASQLAICSAAARGFQSKKIRGRYYGKKESKERKV